MVKDHPRVCGEHRVLILMGLFITGSSPRMRGARQRIKPKIRTLGIIPAYAGSTRRGTQRWSLARDHPRVCGEHDLFGKRQWCVKGSSPRMRGALLYVANVLVRLGIIPAYAGSTLKNPSSESRNPIIELHFNQFAKKVKRCFAIRFRPMRHFIVKAQ